MKSNALPFFYFNCKPDTGHRLDEDEQLARALQESMNDGPSLGNICSHNCSLISHYSCKVKLAI